jgi:hypothetical protein
MWRFALFPLSLLALPRAAEAVDGVSEINQTRALAGNVTPGDAPDFPVTLSAPGSFRLTGNLSVSDPAADGIEVAVDGVTIDLNGFEISGPVVCSGLGSAVSCSAGTGEGIDASARARVTVREGRVRGFGSFGIRLGERAQVRGVIVESTGGDGIRLDPRGIVSGVTVFQAAARGIALDGGRVEGSSSSSNRLDGISFDSGEAASVLGCSVYDNGRFGILAETRTTVHDSSSFRNEATGILINGGGVVSGNSANQNGGDGILLNGGGLASGNFASQNTDDGIESSTGGATVVHNTSNGNGGWGFRGAATVTDSLGGNNFVSNAAGGALNAIAIQCNTTDGVPFCPP